MYSCSYAVTIRTELLLRTAKFDHNSRGFVYIIGVYMITFAINNGPHSYAALTNWSLLWGYKLCLTVGIQTVSLLWGYKLCLYCGDTNCVFTVGIQAVSLCRHILKFSL